MSVESKTLNWRTPKHIPKYKSKVTTTTKTLKKEKKIQILSMSEFISDYKTKTDSYNDRGGTGIYNDKLDKILLVKGIVSKRWGFPKGIRNKNVNETDFAAALRETSEEIDFTINLMIPILPSITVDDATIYGICVPETTIFKAEEKEILAVDWFNIATLSTLMKKNSTMFTKMVKTFINGPKCNILKNKVNIFRENYIPINGIFNLPLEKHINTASKINIDPMITSYNIYYLIKMTYPGVFNDMEIISLIRKMNNIISLPKPLPIFAHS